MSADSLAGRVALVTGGSGGIGAALCRHLAAAEARVAVHYRSGREPAEQVAGSIRAAGGTAVAFAADLADPGAPIRLADEVEAGLGPIDVLAANAGLSRPGSYDEIAAAFDETLAVNLRARMLRSRQIR